MRALRKAENSIPGAALDPDKAKVRAPASAPLLTIAVHRDFASVAGTWRALEKTAIASSYQRFAFLDAWQRHCGQADGYTPMIVTGFMPDGRPGLLWPMGLHKAGPVTVASWLGGKHANVNLGLYEPDCAASLDAAAIRAIFARIAELAGPIDAFDLNNQPASWMGLANPLRQLAWQVAPNAVYSTSLPDDFGTLVDQRRGAKGRKRLRWRTRKLEEIGELRMYKAQTPAEAHRILDAFLEQRALRMDHAGLDNPFAQPPVQAMLRELADAASPDQDSALQLFALEVEGRIIATYGGAQACGRFSASFNSFDMSPDFSRSSPGELLLNHVIEDCIANRLSVFDLGAGKAGYKEIWCDTEELLFDTLYPVSPLGSLYCLIRSSGLSAKRIIKNNAFLWNAARLARQLSGRSHTA